MFITDEIGKMPIPPALLGGEDSSYWGYVKLHLHTPWFYCVYQTEDEDGGEFRHMILLSHHAQLQDMSHMDGIEIVEVQVVLPAHITNQGRWIMSPLASIWEGEMPGEDYTECVYVTLSGHRFSFNGKVTNENQLADKRILFQSPVGQAS